MLERIMVALDGSALAESTLPHAMALARALGAEIWLIRVLECARRADAPPTDCTEWALVRAEASASLEARAEELRREGIEVTTEVAEGRAAEQIVDRARAHAVDLLVVGSHGEGGDSRSALSSTALKILQMAGRSVLVVRGAVSRKSGAEASPYDRVVLPLDGSKRAEWAVPLGATLARRLGVGLDLLSVVPVPETILRPPLTPEDQVLVDRLVERGRAVAEAYLEDQRAHLAGLDLVVRTRVVVSGQTGQTLDDVLEDKGRTLAVLTAHGATGDSSWPYGSVASCLLRDGSGPVLVLQDQGKEAVRAPERELARDDSRYRTRAS